MQLHYLISRLSQTVVVMVLVSILTFWMLTFLPGDAVTVGLSSESEISIEQIESAREQMGLNRPIYVQYLDWAGGVLTGDWGDSTRTGEPVLQAIKLRLPVTLTLSVAALIIALAISIPAGIMAAIHRNTWFDRLATGWALAGVAMPAVWLGLLLILLFSVVLDWLPPSGYRPLWDDPLGAFQRLAMPAFCLGVGETASLMRQTRSSMIEVLTQDYVRTARAKGLAGRTVIVRHALRNAMLPVLTVVGLRIGSILSGAVVIETVFAIPGMGRWVIQAVFSQDLPVAMGFVLIVAFMTVIANLATDLAYGLADPRIQVGRRVGAA